MFEFILCFVFDEDGGYRPVSYEVIAPDGVRSPEYANRYFLPLHGYLLEVSQQSYLAFYKEQRRYRYTKERAKKKGDISYYQLGSDDTDGESIIRDVLTNVEEEAIRNVMAEKLHIALALLPAEEQLLVHMIYFEQQTEAQCGEVFGVSHQAIHKRKGRILEKLRKILEIGGC